MTGKHSRCAIVFYSASTWSATPILATVGASICQGSQGEVCTSALACLREVTGALECWEGDAASAQQGQPGNDAVVRMRKYAREWELATYITNNAGLIVNYGERHRNGERISTGFVESTINQVVSKRMVKKQQMQWTPEGAHLLLQVRTKVINEEWVDTFRTWYPGFRPLLTSSTPALVAA